MSGNHSVIIKIVNNELESEKVDEFLGMDVYSIFKYENHINKIRKNGSQKLQDLDRISPLMGLEKRATIKAFITPFLVFLLVLMLPGQDLINKINSFTYGDTNSTFEDSLERYNFVFTLFRTMPSLRTT